MIRAFNFKMQSMNKTQDNDVAHPNWLTAWMEAQAITLWGVADLRPLSTPPDKAGNPFPRAISFAIPMNPAIMAAIRGGPNQDYADEYADVNDRINTVSVALASEIVARGFDAKPLAASVRSDPVNIRGDFPHKTAATCAGLGWIGRHCQLITRPFGSWVRLGTVFTVLNLACGKPTKRNYCGKCMGCVEACPAKALSGNEWYPGLARGDILNVRACDQWKKKHFFRYHQGHNCGICSAVCPYGQKVLSRMKRRPTQKMK
jgi:epoxyqueuosine reductase QueG